MSDRKRKLAGVLSLGALAAGAGSTASASLYNPFSWGVGEKLKSASETVKSLIKGSEVYQADKILYDEAEIKKGYAAAINIAERIYNVLKSSGEKKALINKLKELCINGNTINEQIKNSKKNFENAEFVKSISSYASSLKSIAGEIGLDINNCFTENIDGYKKSKSTSNASDYVKMINGQVIDDGEKDVYEFFVAEVGQTLSFSNKLTGKLFVHYSSNTKSNNEKACLKAIDNIEEEIFNTYLKDDKDGSKAKKLIASLIINKYKNDKDEKSYNEIIDGLLELKVGNENKEFKYSDYVTSFMSEKIEKSIDLKVDPKSDLDYILGYATSNDQANNIFSEKTKNFVKRIADSKITRLAVTGAGAYLGGMVLAPVLGLGLVGTTVLATGTASAANVATDFVSDRNARSKGAWSFSGIGARYNSLSTRIPMTLAVCSAKAIVGTVSALAAAFR